MERRTAKPLARLVALITPKRRWAQFSLATMFVVVTALCVWLAVVVNRAQRQRDAVAAIEALGGWVGYAENPPGRRFLAWLPRDYTDDVVSVVLPESPTTFNDRDLIHLRPLPHLQRLQLNDQVTDAGLRELMGLTGLQILVLAGTPVTDGGLRQIRRFTDLEHLYFAGTNISDAGAAELQAALPKCRIVRRAAYAQ
jgi:hypothetical protein